MSRYRRILLAIDLGSEYKRVCDTARDLASAGGASLAIVHVVEPILIDPAYEGLPALSPDIDEQMADAARRRLDELGEQYAVAPEARWLAQGSPKREIIRLAEERSVDLIVMGSHGRHGVQRLLGSTAGAVLQGAPCDVLAVRVQD